MREASKEELLERIESLEKECRLWMTGFGKEQDKAEALRTVLDECEKRYSGEVSRREACYRRNESLQDKLDNAIAWLANTTQLSLEEVEDGLKAEIENLKGKVVCERQLKIDAQADVVEEAFYAGFKSSGEGWNGEYPFQDCGMIPEDDQHLKEMFEKWKAERQEGEGE